ncbi:MAG: alanine racemase [Clostridia bacterium]|nr:alanine racemase [Clostridia bacterium]
MRHWLKRTWAEIDLDRLQQNMKTIKHAVGDSRVMAVVKADAYGHGAVMAARALAEAGADWLAVSNLDEAMQLRSAGLTLPMLILSYTPPEEAAILAAHHITQTVVSQSHAMALSKAAEQANVSLSVHIKLDTGMSRVGFFCQDTDNAVDEIAQVCALPHLQADGIFTHFAVADEEDGDAFTRQQFDRYMRVVNALEARGITFSLRHCCNSAATLRYPEMHLDMVRPGIILYGLYPDEWMHSLLPLKPVMSLRTHVSHVKTVPADKTVSYGRKYTTAHEEVLATVPIGYADGYTRRAFGKAYMLINGQQVPVRGRICMDQCMLDVSGLADVVPGTPVTVFGQDGDAVLPADTYASWSDTIHYEIVCSIGKRVPRLFMRDGTAVSLQEGLQGDPMQDLSTAYVKTAVRRDVQINALVTVHYFEYGKDYRFDGERHPFWELLYVDKGEVDVTTDKQTYRLQHGDIVFHKPDEFHDVRANGTVAPNLVVIAFDTQSEAMKALECACLQANDSERHLLARIIKEASRAFSSPLNNPKLTALERNEHAPLGSEQMAAMLLEQLLLSLLRRKEDGTAARATSSIKWRSDNDLVERIIAFMEENTFGNLSFADVCRFSAQSATNLKTIFKEVTGMGVMSYYRNLKIEQAKRMLREGDGNITQIADRLGYTSVHYFSRYFKRVTGMTPSEYTLSIQAKMG